MNEEKERLWLPFPRALTKATFIERANRFILHCQLPEKGELAVVHLADPGRLKELLLPGKTVWLMDHDNPARKTKWTAMLCENETNTSFVSIHTALPNKLVENALKAGVLNEFAGWFYKKSEYKLGNSRWDFLLENKEGQELLLEVKSVTLAEGEKGMFPDAVTARGTKHVRELAQLSKYYETAILFIVQRDDLSYVTAAKHIDPKFAQALNEAKSAGVKLYARCCHITVTGIGLGSAIPVKLE
ncbi:sugar fermentation stimulation protein [Robertmurraya siralis]|uniref:Sugar fermentation stimulation protein homolog n=1 Tax=Robertmurraya siralis TaxID=77777 RepID=A0A920BUQ0_9BACI|nr:DNA/RNA nuclease SfsA [Robertmurraya siralis]PAE19817.1 DNA/RNA nuclease SfsA [Bacillus sp. 7504-2]GIN63485.1 sugar fermentation stimulation protein [Robertmurraya siralis]